MAEDFLIYPPLADVPELKGPPIRLGILSSGKGTNFEAIVRSVNEGRLNAIVEGVIYATPGAGVADRADYFDIPSTLVDRTKFRTQQDFNAEVANILDSFQSEWIVMAGWMREVTPELVEPFLGQMINIYPGLSPNLSNDDPVEKALQKGVKITGCTAHVIDDASGDGPVIMQAALTVRPDDDRASLHERIQRLEHRIYPAAVALAAYPGHAGGR